MDEQNVCLATVSPSKASAQVGVEQVVFENDILVSEASRLLRSNNLDGFGASIVPGSPVRVAGDLKLHQMDMITRDSPRIGIANGETTAGDIRTFGEQPRSSSISQEDDRALLELEERRDLGVGSLSDNESEEGGRNGTDGGTFTEIDTDVSEAKRQGRKHLQKGLR